MKRLRTRVGAALVRSPARTVALAARYLAHDARWPSLLGRTGLDATGLDDLLATLDAIPGRRAHALDELTLAIEVGQAVSAHLGRARTCLERALSRYALLREHGHAPQLVLAVEADAARRTSDAIGHAWVEVQGRAVPPERLGPLVVSLRHPDPTRLVPLPGTPSP